MGSFLIFKTLPGPNKTYLMSGFLLWSTSLQLLSLIKGDLYIDSGTVSGLEDLSNQRPLAL